MYASAEIAEDSSALVQLLLTAGVSPGQALIYHIIFFRNVILRFSSFLSVLSCLEYSHFLWAPLYDCTHEKRKKKENVLLCPARFQCLLSSHVGGDVENRWSR